MDAQRDLLTALWSAFDEDGAPLERVRFVGPGTLDAAFAVSEFAAATVAIAALAARRLVDAASTVTVDRARSCAWFATAVRPVGWSPPSPWDALAGDYRTADGWIRLHTNAPHHRAAAVGVLGAGEGREAVEEAVQGWKAERLEQAVVDAGGAAAVMRSVDVWAAHPQGKAVASEPLVAWQPGDANGPSGWHPVEGRPLAGLRVLDLTRVIAGPVATRFLAGLGASVLRIDPPVWDEPGVLHDMTLGKRTARLDLSTHEGRATLESLLQQTDVLVHGYRADALDRLGFDESTRRALRPGLIDVAIDAYGWSGPWRNRRGFDSLVQMSCGIAEAGARWAGADRPTPLPVQALDHGTGYLAAAAVLTALRRRVDEGLGSSARLSLARTALALASASPGESASEAPSPATTPISTPWGGAQLLEPPVAGLQWELPPRRFGADEPRWP